MAEDWTAQQLASALDAQMQALRALWDALQPEVARRMHSGAGPGQMPPDVGLVLVTQSGVLGALSELDRARQHIQQALRAQEGGRDE